MEPRVERSARLSLTLLATLAIGCGDAIEGEWAYRDEPDDLFLEARFAVASGEDGSGDVLFDIAHVPNVEMAVSWWLLDDGRYRLDFRCLDLPERPDLECESFNFWLACALDDDRLQCDFADCAECGSFEFERKR